MITDPCDTHITHTSTPTHVDSSHTRTSSNRAQMNVSTSMKQMSANPTDDAFTWSSVCALWFPPIQILQLQVTGVVVRIFVTGSKCRVGEILFTSPE